MAAGSVALTRLHKKPSPSGRGGRLCRVMHNQSTLSKGICKLGNLGDQEAEHKIRNHTELSATMSGDVLLKRKSSMFGNDARFISRPVESLIFLFSRGAHSFAKLGDRVRKLRRGVLVFAGKALFLFTAHVVVAALDRKRRIGTAYKLTTISVAGCLTEVAVATWPVFRASGIVPPDPKCLLHQRT